MVLGINELGILMDLVGEKKKKLNGEKNDFLIISKDYRVLGDK